MTAISKKGRLVFRKNRGVTRSVAAPGVTHPSDATGISSHRKSRMKVALAFEIYQTATSATQPAVLSDCDEAGLELVGAARAPP